MLKPYRDEFTDELYRKTKVHPSTKTFAHFTKNIDAAHTVSALALLCISVFNGLVPTLIGPVIGFMGVTWIIYTGITLMRSPWVVRRHYNEYLYPIEVAFNQLEIKDQKKYKHLLNKSYKIAARGQESEFDELTKILELFELSIPEDTKAKSFSVDDEIQLKRKLAEQKQKEKDDLQKILDELNGH